MDVTSRVIDLVLLDHKVPFPTADFMSEKDFGTFEVSYQDPRNLAIPCFDILKDVELQVFGNANNDELLLPEITKRREEGMIFLDASCVLAIVRQRHFQEAFRDLMYAHHQTHRSSSGRCICFPGTIFRDHGFDMDHFLCVKPLDYRDPRGRLQVILYEARDFSANGMCPVACFSKSFSDLLREV